MVEEAVVRESARALYALPAAEFIAARTTRAKELKQAGHLDEAALVGRFKKPSAGAAAVNRLMAHDSQLAEEIAELGSRLRTAQTTADAADLRALDRERRELLTRARDAARASDPQATSATLTDVEQTVWAALVDAQAAGHVLAASLIRALSPGGFGEVDTSGASAIDADPHPDKPTPPRRRTRTSETQDRRAQALRQAQEALALAQEEHRRAQDELEAATRSAAEATRQHDELAAERDELRVRLEEVGEALRAARATAKTTTDGVRDAERRRRLAAAQVDRALRQADAADQGSS
jgi:hypothetical protein